LWLKSFYGLKGASSAVSKKKPMGRNGSTKMPKGKDKEGQVRKGKF
jgi:hypothetical protein